MAIENEFPGDRQPDVMMNLSYRVSPDNCSSLFRTRLTLHVNHMAIVLLSACDLVSSAIMLATNAWRSTSIIEIT